MLYLYIACEYFLCVNNQGPNLVCPTNFQNFGPCEKTLVQCMYSYYSNSTPTIDL